MGNMPYQESTGNRSLHAICSVFRLLNEAGGVGSKSELSFRVDKYQALMMVKTQRRNPNSTTTIRQVQ
ncbi:hypothetical protein SCLCIDRAFT_1221148 [Scleroderma citrinum Foug A]|uniref:Uncharacterized protein n=1 Tax=Scleroderma citrinum Foug A TaxID=1036808 RepID=A0A0C3DGG7_9AGAM|nr:hypothetical protein SCLCIDRAFT_1221148 [Scleroderma citrinum Foug A]